MPAMVDAGRIGWKADATRMRLLFRFHSLLEQCRTESWIEKRRNSEMTTGTVKFFNEQKGFGFIQPEDGGADSFVHISDVERSGMSTLRENQRVSYDVEQDERGKMKATNLRAAEGAEQSQGDAQ